MGHVSTAIESATLSCVECHTHLQARSPDGTVEGALRAAGLPEFPERLVEMVRFVEPTKGQEEK